MEAHPTRACSAGCPYGVSCGVGLDTDTRTRSICRKGVTRFMIHPQQLGLRIAASRRARGLTQGQVAACMGVSPQAVSKWERGLACPDLVFLDDLAALLGVSLEELLIGTPTPRSASA